MQREHFRLRCWLSAAVVALVAACAVALVLTGTSPAADTKPLATSGESLTMVVMDPLAAPLACPCVKGYAQRDYEKLAAFIGERLGRNVRVVFSESLAGALKDKAKGQADIVIGKQSVIDFELKTTGHRAGRVARLTGKDGKTTQTGMFIVPSADKAKSVVDLAGYRVIFGPAECEEKHSAAIGLLTQQGVSVPANLETLGVCSDAAELILKLEKGAHGAAVISSYAEPLLEGCGKVKKGDLRIIGQTAEVPFIAVYVADSLSQATRAKLRGALLKVGADAALCSALESKSGFVADEPAKTAKKK